MPPFDNDYRDELLHWQELAGMLAHQHPQLASFLSTMASDPDVAKLKEGAAFLNATLRGEVTDEFSTLTQGILQRVWDFPLRPIPSTAILALSPTHSDATSAATYLPAGAPLSAWGPDKQRVYFQTCRALALAPLTLVNKALTVSLDRSDITLTFRYDGAGESWQTAPFTLFLGPDPAVGMVLRRWFSHHLHQEGVGQADNVAHWRPHCCQVVPLTQENLLLPGSHPDYWPLQLLTESCYLPQASLFVTVDLSQQVPMIFCHDTREFTLHLIFDGGLTLTHSQLHQALWLHCVPVANLHAPKPRPITANHAPLPLLTHEHVMAVKRIDTPLEPQELHSIPVTPPTPRHFYPLTELTLWRAQTNLLTGPLFYDCQLRRDVVGRQQSWLRFYDAHGQPLLTAQLPVSQCHLVVTDERAAILPPDPPLQLSAEITGLWTARFLTAPTPLYPAQDDAVAHWGIISQLACNPHTLTDKAAFQRMLHDLTRRNTGDVAATRLIARRIAGIQKIVTRGVDSVMPRGIPRRGWHMILTLEADHYPLPGEMALFAETLAVLGLALVSQASFFILEANTTTEPRPFLICRADGLRAIM